METVQVIFIFSLLFTSVRLVVSADNRLYKAKSVTDIMKEMKIKELRIATIEHEPWYMVTNESHRGYFVDLMNMISNRLGRFPYKFYLVPDGRYGRYNTENNSWSGLINELIIRESAYKSNSTHIKKGADLAAASLIVSSKRSKYVDFTSPIAHDATTILVKKAFTKPKKEWIIKSTFSIFRPLTPAVWISVFIAMILVGITLWIMNRYNPYEWSAHNESLGLGNESSSELFSLSGALWFMITTLLWQGYERAPRSIASKVASGFWMAFVALTLLTYAGSLLNHLFWATTVHSVAQPAILDVAHLVNDHRMNYGTVIGDSTWNHMKHLTHQPLYSVMFGYWNTEIGKKQLVKNIRDGVKRVRNSEHPYALLTSRIVARYVASHLPCDLTTVGDDITSHRLSMALPRGSPLFRAIDDVLVEFWETGELQHLERRWYDETGDCYKLKRAEQTQKFEEALYANKPRSVDMDAYLGVIGLMATGLFLAYVSALGEILYFRYRGRYQAKNRPGGRQLKLDDDVIM